MPRNWTAVALKRRVSCWPTPKASWRRNAFGVGQQLASRFGPTAVHLRGIEHALLLLSLQLSHALLVQRDVQGSTILFELSATDTQNRDQQKTQGNQK